MLNNNGPAHLLINQIGAERPWIGVRVEETSGRPALGALLELARQGAPSLWRRVATDGSYASASDPRALFGLGGGAEVVEVRVHWPGGAVETWPAPELRQYTSLKRGTGRTAKPKQ